MNFVPCTTKLKKRRKYTYNHQHFFQILNFVKNRKADNIMWGVDLNCMIWLWTTKFWTHWKNCVDCGIFFVCHHIMQFKPPFKLPFYLGLLYKHCQTFWQTSDMLISVLYITTKPKWIDGTSNHKINFLT